MLGLDEAALAGNLPTHKLLFTVHCDEDCAVHPARGWSAVSSDSSNGSVAAPCTPDLSEKDAGGDSEDVVMGDRASSAEGSLEGEVAEAAGVPCAAAVTTQQMDAPLSREVMDVAMEAAAQRLLLEMGENPLRAVSRAAHVILPTVLLVIALPCKILQAAARPFFNYPGHPLVILMF